MVHLLIIKDWVNVMKKVYHLKFSLVMSSNLVLMLPKIIVKVKHLFSYSSCVLAKSFLFQPLIIVSLSKSNSIIVMEMKLYLEGNFLDYSILNTIILIFLVLLIDLSVK
jgi:hypothetical protein